MDAKLSSLLVRSQLWKKDARQIDNQDIHIELVKSQKVTYSLNF